MINIFIDMYDFLHSRVMIYKQRVKCQISGTNKTHNDIPGNCGSDVFATIIMLSRDFPTIRTSKLIIENALMIYVSKTKRRKAQDGDE